MQIFRLLGRLLLQRLCPYVGWVNRISNTVRATTFNSFTSFGSLLSLPHLVRFWGALFANTLGLRGSHPRSSSFLDCYPLSLGVVSFTGIRVNPFLVSCYHNPFVFILPAIMWVGVSLSTWSIYMCCSQILLLNLVRAVVDIMRQSFAVKADLQNLLVLQLSGYRLSYFKVCCFTKLKRGICFYPKWALTYSIDSEFLAWSSTASTLPNGEMRPSTVCILRRWINIPLILIQKGIILRKW